MYSSTVQKKSKFSFQSPSPCGYCRDCLLGEGAVKKSRCAQTIRHSQTNSYKYRMTEFDGAYFLWTVCGLWTRPKIQRNISLGLQRHRFWGKYTAIKCIWKNSVLVRVLVLPETVRACESTMNVESRPPPTHLSVP